MRRFASVVLAVSLAACGGTPNTPDGSVVNSGGGSHGGGGQYIFAGVIVTIPSESKTLRARYLSPRTQSIALSLASVDGAPVSGTTGSTIETYQGAPSCSRKGSALQCTGTVEAVQGSDVFNVTTFAWKGGNGPVLSAGTVGASVNGSNAVGINSAVSLALDGVIAKLGLAVTPSAAHLGKAQTSTVALTAYDAAGAVIVGASAYQMPVQLSIQGDAAAAYSLRSGSARGSTLTLTKPESDIALAYDGSEGGTSVSIEASIPGGGTGAPSANAAFRMIGVPPPPKGGPIYVLDAGSNAGRGAHVTVYDPAANGNAAPVRTLALSSSLYAQSIAEDSKGNLYVGYFDSTLGFDPGTHLPDDGNEIAVYAPNATGNAKPLSILTSDASTSSALFPSSIAFDPSGELVTFGATSVAGTQSDSVLVYGSFSGAVAPSHAWNFASPTVTFPGMAGVAVDRSGNFYVNGGLHTSLGPNNGVFVAAASDENNPSASVARSIPWNSTTGLAFGAIGVGVDASGEVYVANAQQTTSGSTTTCAAQINVFASGSTGGVTDAPPVRTMAIDGFTTTSAECSTPNSPLAAAFPAAVVYGASLYAASPFNDAVAVLPANASGSVKPAQIIAGSATQLDDPIGVAVGPAARTKEGPNK